MGNFGAFIKRLKAKSVSSSAFLFVSLFTDVL